MNDLNKLKDIDYSDIPIAYKVIILSLIERTEIAEAELALRDAAAGDPVGLIRENPDDIGLMAEFEVMPPAGTKLYTVAKPAVLPPEMLPENTLEIETLHGVKLSQMQRAIAADAYNQCRADALALGAQQQKVVELPWGEWGVFGEADLLAALDAANVKWEVKK